MKLIILVISLCCGSCIVNSARCPKNPVEKINEFGELSKQLGLRRVKNIQSLCGKLYKSLNTVIDVMKYCDEYKNSKYRLFQQNMFSTLYSVCPPVGLEEDASALIDKTGGDCTAMKGECARLASQTLDHGDAGRSEVCRSHKPTVECSVIYVRECIGSETQLIYSSVFASYLRYYVSYCRNNKKPGGAIQEQNSPSNKLSQIRCARMSRKCSKIAQKANVKNCSIMKKSYRCIDKYVKACKWMLSPETLNDIQISRSDLYNQCSLGADMMMGDDSRKASELSKAKCNLKVKHCSDMIIDANSNQNENCRNAKEIKECLQGVIDRCSNSLNLQLISNLKTTQQGYQACMSNPCPNPVRDYERCEDIMNGISPDGLCKKGSEVLKCYEDYMERCENKTTDYMKGGVTSFRKMLTDYGCLP